MRNALVLVPVTLVILSLSPARPLAAGAADPSVPQTVCDVDLNVMDKDPKGLNVRATPQVLPNNVRTRIPHADWTRVHVVGMSGDWYQISNYQSFNDNGTDDDEPNDLPGSHRGWVHKSMLGDVDAFHGALMYAAPSARGKPIYHFPADEMHIDAVLGCKGKFLHVRYKGTTGWLRDVCTNERTTCV